MLIAAGDNPDQLHSEAAFAHMCAVAPIPASSGKTTRHRLNRRGNHQANRALYALAIGRIGYDPRAKAYATRHTTEDKAKPEIIRYLTRKIHKAITSDNTITTTSRPNTEGQAA